MECCDHTPISLRLRSPWPTTKNVPSANSHAYTALLVWYYAAAPEMNYDATNEAEPAGEVLLRGPQIFSGYYKQVSVQRLLV